MAYENMTLKKASIASLHEARFYLSFIPIVGHLLAPKESQTDRTKDSDDQT
jgi:hypothetical protein